MARAITLRWAATCADCGAALEVGAPARYYGRGRVYGVECYPQRVTSRRRCVRFDQPDAVTLSKLDPHGVYAADGTRIGSTYRCIDYPCCGH